MVKYILMNYVMKLLKKADIIVIVAFLTVAGVLFAAPAFYRNGGYVKITQEDRSSVYSVNENRIIDVNSNSYNLTVVIENKEVYIRDADCPDKVCKKTGKIRAGGSIVCIPARVIVEFTESTGDGDALAG